MEGLRPNNNEPFCLPNVLCEGSGARISARSVVPIACPEKSGESRGSNPVESFPMGSKVKASLRSARTFACGCWLTLARSAVARGCMCATLMR